MWNLIEIYAQNICSFKELHYKPVQGVTTLIFGDNRDNESQKSNGSGKSALIECISLGITGNPLRKIKTEEIINDSSDECLIELQFKSTSSNEIFTIERKLFRKASSEVACYITRGTEFDPDEAVQHSNDAYNKFIIEKLGITKDELYNNFILSKHKYQNFLSCSDREKKDIINNFSNGNLVDQAIANIIADKTPYEELLKKTDLELATCDGRIEILREQIEEEKNNRQERALSRDQAINELREKIQGKRSDIREKGGELNKLADDLSRIEQVDKDIQDLENQDLTFEEYLERLNAKLSIISQRSMSDWESVFRTKNNKIAEAQEELKKWNDSFAGYDKKVIEITLDFEELNKEYQRFISVYDQEVGKYDEALNDLEREYKELNSNFTEITKVRRSLAESIELLRNKLAGIIACPKCGFEFILADRDFDVTEGRTKFENHKTEYDRIWSEIEVIDNNLTLVENKEQEIKLQKKELQNTKHDWSDRIGTAKRNLDRHKDELKGIKEKQVQITDTINGLHQNVSTILRQVFDEAFELVDDAYKTNERKTSGANEEIKAYEGSIEVLEKSIKDMDSDSGVDLSVSLKKSLDEHLEKSSEILSKKTLIEEELNTLREQEQNFVEFKTYLANTKIEALSKITNEFLENIGSDIRIKFSGFTVLKTGKVREKISVSLIRSGVEAGSYGKFSAGEAARVNLSTILAMQKLTNANCDTDKGLDLLVLDEILEAVDESGLANMFAALNKLGITALVVSHGNIAESYPHTLKIIKEHGESHIEEREDSF